MRIENIRDEDDVMYGLTSGRESAGLMARISLRTLYFPPSAILTSLTVKPVFSSFFSTFGASLAAPAAPAAAPCDGADDH